MARTYAIETFGCQMNFHDAERMAGLLEQAGYERADSPSLADVIVINTCSVRERAEEKLYTRLGEIRESAAATGQRPVVAVTGCVAQQEGESLLRRSKQVDVVVGTRQLVELPGLLERAGQGRPLVNVEPRDEVSFPLGIARRDDPVKAYVTIVEGCNEFCAFCVVPYTRGPERMRRAAEIVAEAEEAVASGRREVQLLGQIVNHYRDPDDPSCDFAVLLARVNAVPGLERIRFASPHPRHVSPALVEAIRDLPHVCKHLHLPVQSGSTRILGAMRRRHTRDEYLGLVDRIRAAVPGIAISTDMIVGFPGETEADFEDTLDLVRRVRYHSMFSFKYSARPNTLADKRMPDDVPEAEKTRRIVALQDLQREIQLKIHEGLVGRVVEVLADARSRRRERELSGRTTGNTVVNFPGTHTDIGRLVAVRIERAGPNSLWGTPVAARPAGPA